MDLSRTYCNPLPLPEFQRGTFCLDKKPSVHWQHDVMRDFREMADPTVLYWQNKWWLFPSCGLLWWSDDFVTWHHQAIEPVDPGYAPTVLASRDGWLYMTACCDKLWRSRHPLGPWELLGQIRDENGQVFRFADPALFEDDDGSIYCYHGLGPDGIYVAKLRRDDLTRFDGPRVHCFAFNTDHAWERFGEHNQDPDLAYIEGGWINKIHGKYYLQYSGPGTEWKNYSVGCYVANGPLGPWRPQVRNPILTHRGGLINGTAHHSIVPGPGGTWWCFYTLLVRIEHRFERRIGMDPVGIDEHGELFVAGPTDTPQCGPGVVPNPSLGNDAGLLPLSVNESVRASSYVSGHEPTHAVDDYIRTWWEARTGGPEWLWVDLHREYDVAAARTMFGDRGLDYEAGILPGPYRYRIEGSKDDQTWTVLCDQSQNTVDRHIAYDTFTAQRVRYVRLVIEQAPQGMPVSVWEFTVFGRA